MQHEGGLSPSDVVGEAVRDVRRRRDLTAKDLAEKCAELGAKDLTSASILNIETGRRGPDGRRRRNVTVDELLVLSSALRVAPVKLLFPMDQAGGSSDGTPPIAVTPGHEFSDRVQLRRWATGAEPLSDAEFFGYFDDEADGATGVSEDRLREMVASAVQKELGQTMGGTAAAARQLLDIFKQGVDKGADLANMFEAAEQFVEAREQMTEYAMGRRPTSQRFGAGHEGNDATEG